MLIQSRYRTFENQNSSRLPFYSYLYVPPQPHTQFLILVTTSLVFISVIVISKMVYIWNQALCNLLGFVFIQHNSLEFYPSCSLYQEFIPFYCWVLFHGTDELWIFNHNLLSGIVVVPVWSHYKWSYYEQFSLTGFHVNLTVHFSGINAAPYGRCMVRFQGTAKLCSRITVTFSIPTM